MSMFSMYLKFTKTLRLSRFSSALNVHGCVKLNKKMYCTYSHPKEPDFNLFLDLKDSYICAACLSSHRLQDFDPTDLLPSVAPRPHEDEGRTQPVQTQVLGLAQLG